MRDHHTPSSADVPSSLDRGPAPGKQSRTQAIQRRAAAGTTATDDGRASPTSASDAGPRLASTPLDDPFAMHLAPPLTSARPIQARFDGAGPGASAPAPSSGGSPLADDVRGSMEHSFATDFSAVRVHEGPQAAAMGAVAFTQGDDVHFQPGAYDPGSSSGRELIGHELTHVVQQREGRVATPQGKGGLVNADPGLEAEADVLGARAARGEVVRDGGSGAAAAPTANGPVQRKVLFEKSPPKELDSIDGEVEDKKVEDVDDTTSEKDDLKISDESPVVDEKKPTKKEPPKKKQPQKKERKQKIRGGKEVEPPKEETKPEVPTDELEPDAIVGVLDEHGALGKAQTIYAEILGTKPNELKNDKELQELVVNREKVLALVTAWHQHAGRYIYVRDAAGAEQVLRDAIKFFFHDQHGWRSVGVAEYMTGDATGLAMAAAVDPTLTIKILRGDQQKGTPKKPPEKKDEEKDEKPPETKGSDEVVEDTEKKKESLIDLGGSIEESKDELKVGLDDKERIEGLEKSRDGYKRGPTFMKGGTLSGDFKRGQEGGNIVIDESTNDKDEFKGTSDRYSQKYTPFGGRTPKPWNKETYEATRVIGDKYKEQEKRKIIEGDTQLGEGQDELKGKIEEYKKKLDEKVGGAQCVFLWGRTSGQHGGAHRELDSHPEMMLQLAKMIREKFPDRVLVIVGDEVLNQSKLTERGITNQCVVLNQFWNDETYGPYLKDRKAQRYLFQLFDKENSAVSIGMRSGSLEGLALLGLRVIFLDDLGNNAEGRMEFWSGEAAKDRGKLFTGPEQEDSKEKRTTHETSNEGPMKNYKRVGTTLQLGNILGARVDTLKKATDLLHLLLTGNDGLDKPFCDDEGNDEGNNIIWAANIATNYAGTLCAGIVPTDRKVIEEFCEDIKDLVNDIEATGFKGKKGGTERSTMLFHRLDVDAAKLSVKDLATEAGDLARNNLGSLEEATDDTGPLIGIHDTTSGGVKLLGQLLVKGKATQTATDEDAGAFNKMYGPMSRQFKSVVTKGQAGQAKFKKPEVQKIKDAVDLMSPNVLLQPDELKQIEFLTGHLSPDKEKETK